jgi:hypothetical protein
MNKIRFSLLIVLCSIYSIAFCQSQLNFISKSNGKRLTFKVGDNVGYAKRGFTAIRTGKLEAIKDSTITIDGKIIKITDLRLIGHRKKGTSLMVITTGLLAGALIGWYSNPAYYSGTERTVGVSIGTSLFAAGEIISINNKVYKVSKYSFEVLP